MASLNQGLIIEMINQQFKKMKLPSSFKFNEGGVCRGLATVYAQHVLQGKEAEFKEMLELIASGKFSSDKISEDEVLLFATRVLISFMPSVYIKSLAQNTSMETLDVEGKRLKSSFSFALATSRGSWASIINELKLQDDEVMVVSSINHAVTVHKKNGKYIVYDPNYSEGFKQFKDEKALVWELHTNVFAYNLFGNLGLKVEVIRHPDSQPRAVPFPDITTLYEKYLGSKNSTATILISFPKLITFDTFLQAAKMVNNQVAINALLKKIKPNDDTIFEAAKAAVWNNNVNALLPLMEKIKKFDKNNEKMTSLINIALSDGRFDSFVVLEREFDNCFKGKSILSIIKQAAIGGDPLLLEKVISRFHNHYKENQYEYLNSKTKKPSQEPKQVFKEEVRKGLDQCIAKSNLSDSEKTQFISDRLKLFDDSFNSNLRKQVITTAMTLALPEAIKSGSPGCVNVILEELKQVDYQLTDQEKLAYLLKAIKQNNREVVIYLIGTNPTISKELLGTISMSALAVKNTDLDVLNSLKNRGVNFSTEAQNVFNHKQKDEWLNIKTVLNLVLDYLQSFFGKQQVTYEKKLYNYKRITCESILGELGKEAKKLESKCEQLEKQIKDENKNDGVGIKGKNKFFKEEFSTLKKEGEEEKSNTYNAKIT